MSRTVSVEVASDLAPIEAVKAGRVSSGQIWPRDAITVHVDGPLEWPVDLAPGERRTLTWSLTVDDEGALMRPGPRGAFARPVVSAYDRRIERLVDRSLDDLAALRLTTPGDDGDTFLRAGVPWYLTLFGRDSLWAARMMLPLGTGLAIETLRVLGRRQGTRTDPDTGEAPGKIMHELRRSDVTVETGCPRSITARSTPPRSGSTCSPTPGAGVTPRPRSPRCCRTSRRR
ncbi:hypothetical protein [Actinoplanes sp. NPDC051411]|uniref:hypothetical protein n=1 Tax=Actinoplanes sp. NPDC051411 TaxID=3155522 RepID=UPI00341A28F8